MTMVAGLSSNSMASNVPYYTLLVAALLEIVAANSRSLEGNGNRDEGDDNNDDASTQNKNNGNIFSEYWNLASSRLKDDSGGMWTSSPSEWGEEYWEVFAAMAAILFGILLCFCLLCCCVPCLIDDSATRNHQLAMTKAELDAKRRKEKSELSEPILDGTSKSGEVPDRTISQTYSPPPTMGSNTDMSGDDARLRSRSTNADATSIDSEPPPPPRPRSRVKRKSIWSEVVEAWTEFLTEGYKAPDDVAGTKYKGEAFIPRDGRRRGRKKFRLDSQSDADIV